MSCTRIIRNFRRIFYGNKLSALAIINIRHTFQHIISQNESCVVLKGHVADTVCFGLGCDNIREYNFKVSSIFI
ncbi:hypothetical protein D3C75_642180 [compost metagenome]